MSEDFGVFFGRGSQGDAWSGAQLSSLILGPSRSGKTSSIVIPNLLQTSRAVIATSTKSDVVHSVGERRRDVPLLVFDPSGVTPIPSHAVRVGYSPLRPARAWDGAVMVAQLLTDTQRRGHYDQPLDHWSERSSTLLASLLHAAALEDRSLPDFANRIDRRLADDARALLTDRYGEAHPAVAGMDGVLACSERELSSIWSTTSGLLRGLRTEAARQSSRLPPVELDAFLESRAQLHVVAPSRAQAVSVPLVVGMIDEIVAHTYASPGRLLLALDELANVAPLPHLASIVSEGGGQGVITLACLQDLSQARARWGSTADGFLSLFPTSLVLPGIADRVTLDLVSSLAGLAPQATRADQYDHRGRRRGGSLTLAPTPRLQPADVAHGRGGHALALSARKQLGWVELAPYYRDERYRPSRERSSRSW